MQNQVVIFSLGYLGLAPFYLFVFGTIQLEDWQAAISNHGFVIYSMAILCFLAGTLWGRAQARSDADIFRFVTSNLLVLFSVAAVLIAQIWLSALLLMLGYLAIFWYESNTEVLPIWYRRLRLHLTVGVVLAHFLFCAAHSLRAH